MGGENRDAEIADFPRQRKRLIRNRGEMQVVSWDDLSVFVPKVE